MSSSSNRSTRTPRSAKAKIRKDLKEGENGVTNRKFLNREKKMALQKDVDKLRKKLRHEENIHRALERAFNRPLGSLPRLPPFLPPSILELLAEVAVLEEEIVRFEEQIVHFRQDLYQEAVYTTTSRRNIDDLVDDVHTDHQSKSPKREKPESATSDVGKSEPPLSRELPPVSDTKRGKENQSRANTVKSGREPADKKSRAVRTPAKKALSGHRSMSKSLDAKKSQHQTRVREQTNAEPRHANVGPDEKCSGDCGPNKISEDLVRCLSNIFLRMSSAKSTEHHLSYLSVSKSQKNNQDTAFRDPYGICSGFGERDVGPYKHLADIDASSIDINKTSSSQFLIRRLKLLLGRVSALNLQRLNHQEKLAFWINIYNACMMNGFLEHGIPESPEMVMTLMRKAVINVGGHLLHAITIEHFILRLPHHSKYIYTSPKVARNDEMAARGKFGLELSEPLVTFALSCGSWSSPAVRVYTAAKVEEELEAAKREYLQAAVGIPTIRTETMGIPKLLNWYLHDFAKDIEALLDWVCLQLPTELGKEALRCLERAKSLSPSLLVHVFPYDFSFRYLFSI